MRTDKVRGGVLIYATPPKFGESYVWPEGVTAIGDRAFINWYDYNEPFELPESVTEIGAWSFGNWYSFNQPFSIPERITHIGRYAFHQWRRFNQPNSTKVFLTLNQWMRIDNWMFCGCWSGTVTELERRVHHHLYATAARHRALAEIKKGINENR